ncbi:MAG: hypothetical protein AAGI66_02750 [Cyanobacteria bacterium P01_H01_bin.74]
MLKTQAVVRESRGLPDNESASYQYNPEGDGIQIPERFYPIKFLMVF